MKGISPIGTIGLLKGRRLAILALIEYFGRKRILG
jgi:hypothetical protein